jgi:AcrR family transcriptional regulator
MIAHISNGASSKLVGMTAKAGGRDNDTGAPTRLRRRGAVLEDALLTAVWEEVTDAGYRALTIEGIAARAHAHKSVIYRRWPNRASLVRAAIRHRLGSLGDDVPDTGDLRQDLLIVMQRFRDYAQRIGPDIVRGLASEAADLPDEVYDVTPAIITTVLQRAAERGEVATHRVTRRITHLPGDLLRHELLTPHGDLTDENLEGILDELLLPLVTAPSEPQQPTRSNRRQT